MEAQTTTTFPTREQSLKREREEKQPLSMPSTLQDSEKDASKTPEQGTIGEEHNYITGFKFVIVMASVTLVAFLMLLDMSIIVTAIPRITSDFHSLPDVGWYGSAYQLASSSLQPLTGKFYTYFSSKWTFLTFFAVFELGSLLCGIASSSRMLIVGRAVAGMGASGLQNGALTIISRSVPLTRRPALIGIIMGFAQLGLVCGPLLGGALTEYTTWRWCFYINLPIGGFVAALLVFIHIPDQAIKHEGGSVLRAVIENLDLVGFALFAPAAIQFLLALQYGGNQYTWNSATIIGLFCGAGGTFILFLMWEYRKGDAAMIPFPMVGKRAVWSSCFVTLFLMGMTFCASYYLPIYFQAVKGVSPMRSGVYLLPNILSQLLFAVISGILVGKLGYYLPWSLFSGIVTAIGNGLVSLFSPTTSTSTWIGYQILLGAGRGSGLQMPIIAVQNALPPAQISVAMSLIIFSQTFGGAILLTFADTIFTNSLKSEIPRYAPSVNPEVVIAAGATAIRTVVTRNELAGVLEAYAKSVDHVFYLTAGAAVACFCFAWGMGWKDIRKKEQAVQGQAEEQSEDPLT